MSRNKSKLAFKFRKLGDCVGRRCWYCGDNVLNTKPTRDHVIPRAHGGLSTPDNLVLACQPCNQRKGSLDLEHYRWLLQYNLPAGERVVFYGEAYPERGRLPPNKLVCTIADAIAFKKDFGL